jgi:hypothetical protein
MTEIVPRRVGMPMPRTARKAGAGIRAETFVEQVAIHALTTIGEQAVSEVTYLKSVQRNAEQANPDAADSIAYIVAVTVNSIARSVQAFSSRLE